MKSLCLRESKVHFRLVNPFTLRVPTISIICYFHTFENNLGIKRKFTKYLKGSCCLTSCQHISFKYFQKKCFCYKNIFKTVWTFLDALSVNGFSCLSFTPLKRGNAWNFMNFLIFKFFTLPQCLWKLYICVLWPDW